MVDVESPEAVNGPVMRVGREDGGSGGPHLVDVLDDDEGLAFGLVFMNENGDFLVNWVALNEELALGSQLLFDELVVDGFDVEGDANPHHKWACPCTQKLHVALSHGPSTKQEQDP